MQKYIFQHKFVITIFLLLSLCAIDLSWANNYPDFVSLVKKYENSVVNISTSQKPRHIRNNLNLPKELKDTPYGEFLKKFLEDVPRGRSREKYSLGSGSIISANGLILTNNHVIRNADEIIVRLSDKREFKAKIIGVDEATDIALLKIDAKNLPTVSLGNSDELSVGEWVVAIGSPFGFEHSVTAGIVSAKGRSIGNERYVPFIQTDVAINPGNSGGPLINMNGSVVGVNAQILSRTGGYLGLSFAIPINLVKDIVEQLRNHGKVSRGWLGITFQMINNNLARSFGMDKPTGALVASVMKDSPAAKGGLQPGDIITKFNGKVIVNAGELPPIVGEITPGTNVKIEVLRKEKKLTFSIKVGLYDAESIAKGSGTQKKQGEIKKLGLKLRNLSKKELGKLHDVSGGVLILDVYDNSIAEHLGLQEGDVILALAQRNVGSYQEIINILNRMPKGRWISIRVLRPGEGERYLAFRLQ